jgi:hypothetical protein
VHDAEAVFLPGKNGASGRGGGEAPSSWSTTQLLYVSAVPAKYGLSS